MIKIADIIKHKGTIYISLGVFLLASLILYPVLESGYINDDSAESLTKGKLIVLQKSLPEFVKDYVLFWITNFGRFFPLIFYSSVFYTLVNNLLIYKLTTIAAVLVNMVLFGYFIKLLSRSTSLSILSTLIVPFFFQFRLYHDPILNYCFLLEIIFALLIGSMILLMRYINNYKKELFVLSILLYSANLLIYEITYAFCLIPVLVIYFSGKKRLSDLIRLSSPYFLVTAIAITIPFIIRLSLGISLAGGGHAYVPNLNPFIYLMTFLRQTFAALPLSYYVIDPNNIFSDPVSTILRNISIIQVILVTVSFILITELLNRLSREVIGDFKKFNLVPLLVLGIALLLLPGVILSVSPKYQGEVIWGYGYLPVYISYFGIVLLIISVVLYLLKVFSNKSKTTLSVFIVIVALSFSILCVINYNNNVHVIEHSNLFWLYPRSIIEDGISNNLFSDIPADSILLVNNNYPWDDSAFYVKDSGLRVKYVGTKSPRMYFGGGGYDLNMLPEASSVVQSSDGTYRYNLSDSDNIYYLSYWSHSESDGVDVLAKVKDISLSNTTIWGVTAKSVKIFVRTPYDAHDWDGHQKPSHVTVSGLWASENSSAFEQFWLNPDQINLISSGEKWKMYEIQNDTMVIDVLSLNINIVQSNVQSRKSVMDNSIMA